MRELEFRVWLHDKGYMETAHFDNGKWISTDGIFSIEVGENDFIEPYTGRKDKNGKKIYAGDIVQEEISLNSEMTDGTFKYRVYWDEEELCWGLSPIGKESIHNELWQCNSSIEVVGNIHEGEEEE